VDVDVSLKSGDMVVKVEGEHRESVARYGWDARGSLRVRPRCKWENGERIVTYWRALKNFTPNSDEVYFENSPEPRTRDQTSLSPNSRKPVDLLYLVQILLSGSALKGNSQFFNRI